MDGPSTRYAKALPCQLKRNQLGLRNTLRSRKYFRNADNVTLNVFEKLKLWVFSAAAEEEELIHKAATLDEAVQIFDLILVRRAKSSTETLSVADIVAYHPSAGLGKFFLILLNQTMTSGLF